MYDLIIIGGGAAALSAAVYAKRFNLNFLVIAKELGGTANQAWVVDNYLGMQHVMGVDIAKKFVDHVKSLNVEIVEDEVKKIKKGFVVKTSKKEYKAKAIILATGTRRRKLDVKGEDEFKNKGVVYCTTCDAPMFRDKDVVVVGCGDSGMNSALMLTQYAKKIYVVVRSKVSAAHQYLNDAKKMSKIEFLEKVNIKEIKGDHFVNQVVLDNGKTLDVQGVFVEIGSHPNSELAKEFGVKLDKEGNIKVNDCMETNIKGIFAAGDITSSGCKFKQLITSASEGAKATNGVFEFLN
ncbi:MAG: NAD(P)/FAD-dependent oxidoreductase [Nanoarchaeota archaeon]|nr:NAD(P)/FAD-dependent oxidoreductase [Nanoarchaeota archaeon]